MMILIVLIIAGSLKEGHRDSSIVSSIGDNACRDTDEDEPGYRRRFEVYATRFLSPQNVYSISHFGNESYNVTERFDG